MRFRLVPLASGLLAFVAAGCYSYVPIESPQRGMDVRAQLETEAAVRRSAGLDDPITSYEGTVVAVDSTELALDVLIARSVSAFEDVEIRDTVRLARTDIRTLQEHRLSPVRSVLVTIAAGAVVVGIVMGIEAISGGTGPEDGEGPPPTFRIPFLDLSRFGISPAIPVGREE